MGRKWKRRSKNKHQKGAANGNGRDGDGNDRRKQADPSKYGQERNPYEMIDGGNFKLESYYAYQGIHDTRLVTEASADGSTKATFENCVTYEEKEEERMRWMTTLKSILPASFRIGNDVDEALRDRLIHELDQFVGKPMDLVFEPKGGQRRTQELNLKPETRTISPAKKLPFIPNAYQLSLDRQTIRRNASLNEFHEWLKIQTQAGFVTRQETVSMLPPVVLNVKPHHKVLDMCAAPGSKTSQILEVVNQKPTELEGGATHVEPAGCVVANDSDNKRAYMLVHQLRRINSPAVLITNCDAQFFPLTSFKPIGDGDDSGDKKSDAATTTTTSTTTITNTNTTGNDETQDVPPSTVKVNIEFDRVLCDVPCSGDGTARKNPGVWKKWNQLNAFGLHVIQLAIAVRGARLTKFQPDDTDDDAGYLCYSTCSMNPIENEAVVAALLRAADGSLELVETTLPGLTYRPGVSTWKVLCEDRSKRQIRDIAKKNSPKMIARRKAWEEKKKAREAVEGKDVDVGALTDENAEAKIEAEETETGTAEDEAESMEVEDASKGNKESDAAAEDRKEEEDAVDDSTKEVSSEKTFVKKMFQPKTFDDAELKACCESAGLSEYESFDEVPNNMRRRIRESCFPPTPEEAAKFHLERCLRILPQDMDTGGFFVSMMRKVAPMTSTAQANLDKLAEELQQTGNDDANEEDGAEPQTKRPKVDPADNKVEEESMPDPEVKAADVPDDESQADGGEKEMARGHVKGGYLRDKDGKVSKDVGRDDFISVPSDIFEPLIDYYGLSASSFDRSKYRIRACSDAKVLYFIGSAVKSFMDQGLQERVTVVNTGLKAFARNNKECQVQYRVAQEGVHFVAPHMTKRKIAAGHADFDKCLNTGGLQLKTFSDEFATKVRELNMGSFVVYLEGFEDDYIKKLVIVMWRCRGDAMNCLVTKVEMDGLRSKLRSVFGTDEQEGDAIEGETEAKADDDADMKIEGKEGVEIKVKTEES